jgi:phosphotransferase system enzyme I (PtsP)
LLLLAMGFDTLSMNARNVLRAKQVIRHFTLEEANACLRAVIKMDDAREIREHMENVLSQAGLGGLIRAGK